MRTTILFILSVLVGGCASRKASNLPITSISEQRTAQAASLVPESSAPTQPAFLILQWQNGNTGNSNVQTGIISSTNLLLPLEDWTVRFITNCVEVTNQCSLPITEQQEYFKAFSK